MDFDQKMNVDGDKDQGVEGEGLGDDVIKSSYKMDPRLPPHDKLLPNTKSVDNTYLLMPHPLSTDHAPK